MPRRASHWVDRVMEEAASRITASKERMRQQVARPVLRRPNTSAILGEALLNPEGMPPQERERLGQWLRERYGESARFIYPYLGLDPEGKEEMIESAPTTAAFSPGADSFIPPA